MKKAILILLVLISYSCGKAQLNSPSWWATESSCVLHITTAQTVFARTNVWYDCIGDYIQNTVPAVAMPSDPLNEGLGVAINSSVFADYNLTQAAEFGTRAKPYGPSFDPIGMSIWLRPLGHVQSFPYYGGTFRYLVEKGVGKTSVSVNTYVQGSNTSGSTTVRIFDPWVSETVPVSGHIYPAGTNATYTQTATISEKTSFVIIELTNLGYFNGNITVN